MSSLSPSSEHPEDNLSIYRKTWGYIENGTPPDADTLTLQAELKVAAEKSMDNERAVCMGLLYLKTEAAFSKLNEEEVNVENIRAILYESSVELLRIMIGRYERTMEQAAAPTYRGLINELTVIALLNSPYASNQESMTHPACPYDDTERKCDAYYWINPQEPEPLVALQIKTDSDSDLSNAPVDGGVIVFGEDYFNSLREIPISILLTMSPKKRTPEDIKALKKASQNLEEAILRRLKLPKANLENELATMRKEFWQELRKNTPR